VIVAMITVRMVKVAIDEIVDMVAMRDGLMPATRSVHMTWLVSGATVVRRATIRILGRHFNDVLVYVIGVRVVKVPIVQVVDVIAMADRRMTAGGAVLMRMIGMMRLGALCHRGLPLRSDNQLAGCCSIRYGRS
jgi:hypothetical protein